MHLLSRRQAIATLLAGAGLLLHRRVVRADHEYVAVSPTPTSVPTGNRDWSARRLSSRSAPSIPKHIEGCNGVIMPAYEVRIERG